LTDPRAGIYSGRMWRVLLGALCLAISAHAAAAPLSVVDAEWDAGAVEAGAKLTHRYVLRNDGARPLTLTVKPECGCTTTDYDAIVPAGGTGAVTAALDVSDVRGRITKRIHVTTDDSTQPPLVLSITADVRRVLDVLPSDRPVVRGPAGAFKPIELTVVAPDGAPFEIRDVEHDALVSTAVQPLAPGRYRLTLTPKNDLAVGSYSAKVTLVTTRPKAERFVLQPTLVVDGPLVVVPAQLRIKSAGDARRVRVSAARRDVRFRVLSVDSSDADLTAAIAPVEDGRTYDVDVRYTGAPGRRPVNALLTINTDVPSQPVVLVRVMGEP
jgi:hypothetical protein